ncbi:MAG: hypothetical protein ACRDIB_16010 [Ardenticatenaceae bacterium]
MAQPRQVVQRSQESFASRRAPAAPDPFAGDFSQERPTTTGTYWPTLQWHGGLANLVGEGDSVKFNGGFFIEDDRIADLGLEPDRPAPGFERLTLRLGGKQIPGWGAAQLHIAFLFTDFCWEDRETGRLRFPAVEYERRKLQAPGTERELRGRTRALIGVRELVDEGVLEPLVLSVRGTYSAAINGILRDANRMAVEATKLRRRAGHEGAIPREAFWMPIYRGKMEDVGEGANTSRVALPKADIPANLTREILIEHLVEEMHRRSGGTFDQWAESYAAAWEEKMTRADEPADGYSANGYDRYVEEEPYDAYGGYGAQG